MDKSQANEVSNEVKNRFSNFSKKMLDGVSVTNDDYFVGSSLGGSQRARALREYTKESAEQTIKQGNPDELRELSQFYFYSSGFYRRVCTYYATLLYYTPIVIPHMVGRKKKITDKKCSERYYSALDLIEDLNFEQLCKHFALVTLREGAYYGMVKESEGKILIQDLPYEFCRSRMKSYTGIDIVEFNVSWFDKIQDEKLKIETLKNFPKEIRKAYLQKSSGQENWVRLPIETGIHFTLYEDRPFFSTIIPSIINVDDYVSLEKDKDSQNLHSLLIQEIPHTANGDLVFEPEEAVEFHKGLTSITKKNKYLDAITSYGKVDVKRILDDDTASKDNLEKVTKLMYAESGVSRQIFSAEGNASVERSIQNDIALMMTLANDFAIWLRSFINLKFSDKNINFSVKILPVGQYNVKDYLTQSLSAAQYGYSSLVPAIAMGFEQKQILDLKDLENDLLMMEDKLIPLRSSHTENGDENAKTGKKTLAEVEEAEKKGASKSEEERSEKTLKNRESSVGGEE